MKTFTGFQYLLIDAANHAGHDKERFEDRIEWATANLSQLESLAHTVSAKSKPIYLKAVMAIRDAQKGLPSGHLVGFDGVCSGIQMMSVLTGCVAGATATGLVDPDRRADAYTQVTDEMRKILGNHFTVSREDAKQSLMTSYYGSRKVPKEVFGEDTPEISAFYMAAYTVAPGAWDLLQALLGSWNSWATVHEWKMPDGYDARVKVLVEKEARIEVDELNHSTFTYEYTVNEGTERGLSNAANIVHSIDGYVLRNIHRRCNYDLDIVQTATDHIDSETNLRWHGYSKQQPIPADTNSTMAKYYIEQYDRSTMADPVIFPYVTADAVKYLSDDHLEKLAAIAYAMLDYEPFEVVSVHDEFRCHANNMNHLRKQYINILAELADSDVLSDILSQVYGAPYPITKLSNNLSTLIRGSSYALC